MTPTCLLATRYISQIYNTSRVLFSQVWYITPRVLCNTDPRLPMKSRNLLHHQIPRSICYIYLYMCKIWTLLKLHIFNIFYIFLAYFAIKFADRVFIFCIFLHISLPNFAYFVYLFAYYLHIFNFLAYLFEYLFAYLCEYLFAYCAYFLRRNPAYLPLCMKAGCVCACFSFFLRIYLRIYFIHIHMRIVHVFCIFYAYWAYKLHNFGISCINSA